jgi:hypothetical protein
MATWRSLVATVVVVAVGQPALAQTYPLIEKVHVGDCSRVQLDMNLTGVLRVMRDGKPATVPLSASASHDYTERVLALTQEGLASKSARHYAAAASTVRVGSERTVRDLPADTRLIVAQQREGRTATYAPGGPLSNDTLALLNEHFDSLSVTGLLAGEAVEKKKTWALPNVVVQSLCQFEGLINHDLTGELTDVVDGAAVVRVTGSASGIELGAMAKVKVEASARFDLLARRLTSLEWKQQDERDQGPASPAVTAETTITLKRAPVEQPKELSDVALEAVPAGDDWPADQAVLHHHDAQGRYDLTFSREWHVVGLSEQQFVLRLMERGDFIAQATVTAIQKAAAGSHLEAAEFKKLVMTIPGFEAEELVQEGEERTVSGGWSYRVTVRGQMEGVSVMQTCYLVAGPKGDQVVVTFTMKPTQATKIGTRDLQLVNGLSLPK